MDVMDEFRSNLLLLLHCRYPEGLGLPLSQLEGEYKTYYQRDVKPNMLGAGSSWEQIFQQPEFREDFITLPVGRTTFIRGNRRRTPLEMSLIAKLAQHSHFDAAKKSRLQVIGCDINNNEILFGPPPEEGQELEHFEVEAISAQLSSVELDECLPQQNGTAVGNDVSPTLAADESQLHPADQPDPDEPVVIYVGEPRGKVWFFGGVPPPIKEATAGPPASAEGFTTVNQRHAEAERDAAEESQLHLGEIVDQPDPEEPIVVFIGEPRGQVEIFGGVPPPTQAATAGPPSPAEGFAEVPQPQAQPVRDDSPSADCEETAEEPPVFKCSTPGCDQEFQDKQHQVDHERRCEMKKYPCTFPGCDRRFRNSKQRHNHISTVHRSPRFKCSVPECTAAFREERQLKVHEPRCRFKYDTLQQIDLEGANATSSASLS